MTTPWQDIVLGGFLGFLGGVVAGAIQLWWCNKRKP